MNNFYTTDYIIAAKTLEHTDYRYIPGKWREQLRATLSSSKILVLTLMLNLDKYKYLRIIRFASIVFGHFTVVLEIFVNPMAVGRRLANCQRVVARHQCVDVERIEFYGTNNKNICSNNNI